MVTDVTSDDFKDLVNPYTGEPMKVKMNVTPTGVMFFCPETYSTSERMETPEMCYDAWNRANGISGVRSGKPIACAYTGRPLSVVRSDFGYYYAGGFDPHMFHSRAEFLYLASMRNGVSKFPAPVPDSRVTAPGRKAEVTDAQRRHANAEAPSLDDEDLHAVEKSVSKFREGPGSTVSRSTGKRHARK